MEEYIVKKWEFNALEVISMFASGVLMFFAIWLLRTQFPTLPRGLGIGVGLFCLFMTQYPMQSIYKRNAKKFNLSLKRAVLASLVGAVVAGILYRIF